MKQVKAFAHNVQVRPSDGFPGYEMFVSVALPGLRRFIGRWNNTGEGGINLEC